MQDRGYFQRPFPCDQRRSRRRRDVGGVRAQVSAERASAFAAVQNLPPAAKTDQPRDVPEVMTLPDALRLAHESNRDLISDREGLILSAIALRNARRDVGPRLAGSVSSVLRGTEDGEDTRDDDAALSLTGLLPTGGTATLSGSADRLYGRGDVQDSSAGGSFTAELTQPLLRGAGYESSHEALTDAERQALYDVRDFELSRQDLALRVQRDYYGLVAQKKIVANSEERLKQSGVLKRQAERLFEADRVSEVDRFRATREHLTSENDVVDEKQDYEARMDRFKILLGLDLDVHFAVDDEIPDTKAVKIQLGDIIRIALRNRLDLMTSSDQVLDAERRLRIRTRELLPQVDLVASRTRAAADRHLGGLGYDDDSFSVGITAELPLDRVRERGALRAARIALNRARRDLSLAEDNVMREVRESLRTYRSSISSLAIQEQIVVSEVKTAKVAALRFEEGTIGNRDLTDAQNNLTSARNRLVTERVNVETARGQLLRDAGVLVIDADGTWKDDYDSSGGPK